MAYRNRQLTAALCFLLTTLCVAMAQTGGNTPSKLTPPGQRKAAGPDEGWWTAQRNIEAAINQLEKYLRESPNGAHAPAARQQLAGLRSLSITRAQLEWVPIRALALPDVPLWRVAGIEQLPERARVTIEIKCGRTDGGDCNFRSFGASPLVLLDGVGELYPMLESGVLPRDIRFARDGQVLLAAGRTLTVIVDFAPLSSSATHGQIQFRDANEAQPAKFSLIQKP